MQPTSTTPHALVSTTRDGYSAFFFSSFSLAASFTASLSPAGIAGVVFPLLSALCSELSASAPTLVLGDVPKTLLVEPGEARTETLGGGDWVLRDAER